jgi:hypothetical protein
LAAVTPAPFTLEGQDPDTIGRMSRTKFSGSLAQKWCHNRGLAYPGLLEFNATVAAAAGLAQEEPVIVANPPSAPPAPTTLFPADENKMLDTLTDKAQESAEREGDRKTEAKVTNGRPKATRPATRRPRG